MDLHQLRSFAAVAREGSLARAAERLHASQPAVSGHLKALEEEWGVALFDRTPQGLRLTRAGEELWDEAERLLDRARLLGARADALRGRLAGPLRLGLNNESETIRAPALVARLAAAHPELRFELIHAPTGKILRGLRDREIDAGYFEGEETPPGIAATLVMRREVVVIGPPAWAEELARADLRELAARPWVFSSEDCSHYQLFRKALAGLGLEPRIDARYSVDEGDQSLRLVLAGLGLSLAPRDFLERHPRGREVARWSGPSFPMPLHFGHLAGRAEEPAIRAAVAMVREVWQLPG